MQHATTGTNSEVQPGAGKTALEAKLALDQLKLVLRNLKPNFWIMPAFAAVTAVMFTHWISVPVLAAWFAAVAAGVMPETFVAALFARADPPPSEARKWLWLCAASYVLATSGFASMIFFLWMPHDIFNNMLIMLLIACSLAGSVAVTGASFPLNLAGFAVYGSAVVFLPLRAGGGIYDGLAVLALIYVVYMVHVSRTIRRAARDMLLLRYDKNELIDALALSKKESDEARERAEAASLAKSQFLANMSHELRTPLNAILGFSEMIHTGALGKDHGRHMEYAGIIYESGHHLLALINDILDLAKIEAGGLQLQEKPLNLKAMIGESVRLMSEKANAGGLILTADVTPGFPYLRADERAIKQILLNLLSNAVKFTPHGGRVCVFAHLAGDGSAEFGVNDTGIGIAEDDQERIFEAFGQGRHDVVTADKGTGLGLAIVKGLVVAHGGEIALVSHAGHGTSVTVRFPAARLCAAQSLRTAS